MHTSRATIGLAVTALLATIAAASPGQAAPASSCTPAWSLVATPAPPGGNTLLALPTPGGSDVTQGAGAVVDSISAAPDGSVWFPGRSGTGPWVLRWNGHAVVQAAQQISPVPPGSLTNGSASPGRSSVGGSFDSDTDGWVLSSPATARGAGFAEHLSGGRWTLTPFAVVPDPATQDLWIKDVAAISPDNAWAVGALYEQPGIDGINPIGSLIEHWDGTRWAVVSQPAADQQGLGLDRLTVISPTDIWAVGDTWSQSSDQQHVTPVTEHYDGTKWAIVPTPAAPNTIAVYATLTTVSASAPNNVWAVGWQNQKALDVDNVPLVEHYDGTKWSLIEGLPDLGGGVPANVYAASGTNVWAFTINGTTDVASFLHWDGKTWTSVPVPGPQEWGMSYTYTAIGGTGPDDIWAAGYVDNTYYGIFTPQIAHLTCRRAGS